MQIHLKSKILLSCGLATLAIAVAAVLQMLNPGAVCRIEELTQIPDDASFFPLAQPADTVAAKWVALTFDDGPSKNTEQILDILKEEQVPATFFVVAADNNEKYLPLLTRIQAEGHQIGLHSCTHNYSEVYADTTSFWADIKELKKRISPYVEDPQSLLWLRFIGGSTNTISHRYGGSSIMKRLKEQAAQRGYHTIDWNVSAEDAAGGHPSAEKILQNITKDAKEKEVCVVLMHDTKATGTTVKALPDIISWFREHGYRFCTVENLPQTGS